MERSQLQEILTGLAIRYKDQPKALNVCCPFCLGATHGKPDSKFLCGIFLESERYHCFRCKRTDSLYHLLSTMAGMDLRTYERLVGKHDIKEPTLADEVKKRLNGSPQGPEDKGGKVELPPLAVQVTRDEMRLSPLLCKFMVKRKPPIHYTTLRNYGAMYTPGFGKYPHRLVVPVYDDLDELVAWQGRDMTGKAKSKYHSEGPIMDLLYWTDTFYPDKPLYVVEGIYDCWRMAYNGVASFSHSLTAKQRQQLVTDLSVKEVVICWDADSYQKSLAAARSLAPIIESVGVVRLPEGEDPDSMGGDAVRELEVVWL